MTVLLVPPDVRAHTLDLPLQLGRIAGLEVRTPPPPCLPRLNEPGDVDALGEWLLDHAHDAEAAIVSLDTLTLGGLIPARRVTTPTEEAVRRLRVLEALRAHGVLIYAHGTILRVATGDDPFEEKPYYARFGPMLRTYGEWADRAERGEPEALSHLERVRRKISQAVLTDYLATRARSRAIHLAALDLLDREVLHRLHLTVDDTSPYGLAVVDRRRIEARIASLGLTGRAFVYLGADEVPCTLLARFLLERAARHVRVAVDWSVAGAERALLRYEDEPLGALVRSHLQAIGLEIARQEPDLWVAVNAPNRTQQEAVCQLEPEQVEIPDPTAFVGRIHERVRRAEKCAVVDVAYANGADDRFVRLLLREDPSRLMAYAGWNTAGNTVGSGLGLAVATLFERDLNARLEALCVRLADDWLYQVHVRQQVQRTLGDPDPFDLGPLWGRAEEEVASRLAPQIQSLWREHFAASAPHLALVVERIELPWPRLHGVRIRLRLVPQDGP